MAELEVLARLSEDYTTDVQTYAEEILNTIIHAMGLMLTIPAAILLVLLARRHGTIWHMFGSGVFGASLIVMYTCSTLYHCSNLVNVYLTPEFLRDLDHCAIYFLIAGTYTPLILVNLIFNNTNNPAHIKAGKAQMDTARRTVNIGWMVLITVWVMAFVGVSTKLAIGSRNIHPVLTYGCYLLMGYMATFLARPFLRLLPKTGIRLLAIGGFSYTFGIIFLVSDTLPFNHPVWHCFVGAGSILHYFSVIACVIPITERAVWKKMASRSPLIDRFTRFAYANLCKNV